jgi:hypothetical protein
VRGYAASVIRRANSAEGGLPPPLKSRITLSKTFISQQLMRLILPVLLIFFAASVVSCTHPQPPQTAMQNEITQTIDGFYDAVAAKDARATYAYLDDDLKNDISWEAFQSYFDTHYSQFLTFAIRLHDESAARQADISAQMPDDPCAQLRLVTDETGQWRVANVPRHAAAESPEQRKTALIQALRTRQFHAVVDDYATRHPEIDRAKIRQLKRVLAFENIPVQNVRFVAKDAIIDIGYDKHIRMSCEPQGWRLVSCSL